MKTKASPNNSDWLLFSKDDFNIVMRKFGETALVVSHIRTSPYLINA